MLLRFEAPHFVAAVDVEDGMVVDGAPILAYMRGWSAYWAVEYAERKGWGITMLEKENGP